MMKLSQAALFFHNTTFADAYRPFVTFKGHLAAYDDNSRDSVSTQRRIMSAAPSVVVPDRRVVKVGDQCWIVGSKSDDFHGEDVLRRKYVIHRADEQAQVWSFEQALRGTAPKTLWASRILNKEMKEPDESSNLYGTYNLYFSESEDIRDPVWAAGGSIDGRETSVLVLLEGKFHLVRTVTTTSGGFLMAVADELPDPVILPVALHQAVYDRALDKKVAATKTMDAVLLRWQTKFSYLSIYSPKYEVGDSNIVILKDEATPTAGDTVTIYGITFRVVTVYDQGNVWSVHIRHA